MNKIIQKFYKNRKKNFNYTFFPHDLLEDMTIQIFTYNSKFDMHKRHILTI